MVFFLCSFPGNKIPEFDLLNKISFDKIVHLGMFGIQAFLLLLAFHATHRTISPFQIIFDVAIFGLALEFMQTAFFINRYGEWIDAVANTIGAILGAVLYRTYLSKTAI